MSDASSGEGSAVTGDSAATPDGTPSGQYVYKLLYGQFAWAPAGDAFAYTERMNQVLYGVQNGKAPVVITKGLDRTFPPSFTSDGKEVAYLVMTPQKVGDASVFQIQAAPVGGGSPHALGSLNISMLCGGDMFDPGDQAYFGEQGLLGDSPTMFKISKFGYLYTMNCNGRGLALSDGTKTVWQNANLQNIGLASDGNHAVAILFNPDTKVKELDIVDLSNGQLQPLGNPQDLDRAIRSSDGKSIIYSTLSAGNSVKGNADSPVGKKLFDTFWPLTGQENNTTLFSIAADGSDAKTPKMLFKDTGRGVGFMSAAHDKPNVIFSAITSTAKLVQAINDGNSMDQLTPKYPHPKLVSVSLDGTSLPAIIAEPGGRPAYSPGDQFSVLPAQITAQVPTLVSPGTVPTLVQSVPPTAAVPTALLPSATPAIVLAVGGNCPGFLPSRLHIGGQGDVLPGRSNNLRASPPSGTIMTTIPAGGVFAVLEGPICTDNGIAWWKVNYNGAIGYTAEGQATIYWLEPYTGAPPPPSGSFGIVGVTAAVSPSSSISCPQTFAFTGQIVVNTGGTVTYKWERSDGTSSSTQSFTFGAGGSQTFTDNWTVTSNFGGWERLHVLTPNDVTSNQANITLACGAVAFHVTSVSVSVDYPNSICPRPPPVGQVFTFTGQINVNAAGSVTYKS